jgi:hypothetical protein
MVLGAEPCFPGCLTRTRLLGIVMPGSSNPASAAATTG